MFSGIITDLGKINFFDLNKKTIEINTNFKDLFLGQSISCSGVCLTVAEVKNKSFLCNLSEETILKTNLNQKRVGDILNLEKSLKLGDEINGHLVYGHVDEICKLKSIEKLNGSNVLTFSLSSNIRKFLAPKCSISIDGISLTVNRVSKNSFNISIIPYTWENTSLKNSKVGDMFNIEIDMLARYVHKALKNAK